MNYPLFSRKVLIKYHSSDWEMPLVPTQQWLFAKKSSSSLFQIGRCRQCRTSLGPLTTQILDLPLLSSFLSMAKRSTCQHYEHAHLDFDMIVSCYDDANDKLMNSPPLSGYRGESWPCYHFAHFPQVSNHKCTLFWHPSIWYCNANNLQITSFFGKNPTNTDWEIFLGQN